jgi:hypothetical protein
MRHRSRGGRHEAHIRVDGAVGASVSPDPAPVPGDAAGTIARGPLQARRPGAGIPARKVMLAALGLTVVVVAILSSYASALIAVSCNFRFASAYSNTCFAWLRGGTQRAVFSRADGA